MKNLLLVWLAAAATTSTLALVVNPTTHRQAFATRSLAPPSELQLRLWRRRKNKEGSGTTVVERETTIVPVDEEKTSSQVAVVDEECVVEEQTETQKLMQQVKDAGVAGVISYAAWEIGFWAISVPVVILGYKAAAGHWPDLADKDDVTKLGAEAFAFVNFARFAVPLRIGLALSTTPWVQANVVDRFFPKKENCEPEVTSSAEE